MQKRFISALLLTVLCSLAPNVSTAGGTEIEEGAIVAPVQGENVVYRVMKRDGDKVSARLVLLALLPETGDHPKTHLAADDRLLDANLVELNVADIERVELTKGPEGVDLRPMNQAQAPTAAEAIAGAAAQVLTPHNAMQEQHDDGVAAKSGCCCTGLGKALKSLFCCGWKKK
jgi:hypothetical protein